MRAYLPGIGPDKDVKLTVSDGMLHIEAERRQGKPGERASAGSCGRETARYRRGPGASRGDGELGQAGAAGAGAAGTWQLVHSLGWGGFGGGLARWTLPVLASIAVIVVHHLGYAEYRNRQLVAISAGCGLLTVGLSGHGQRDRPDARPCPDAHRGDPPRRRTAAADPARHRQPSVPAGNRTSA